MNNCPWLLLLAIAPFPAYSAASSSNSAVAVIKTHCWRSRGETKVSQLDFCSLERNKATEERRHTRSDWRLVVSYSDGGLESGTAPCHCRLPEDRSPKCTQRFWMTGLC